MTEVKVLRSELDHLIKGLEEYASVSIEWVRDGVWVEMGLHDDFEGTCYLRVCLPDENVANTWMLEPYELKCITELDGCFDDIMKVVVEDEK